jgi:hypothetical protein
VILKHLQQLRLHGQRHLPDLVEEDRSPARLLELATLGMIGPGERAALVAEQLALEKREGQGRAIDLHERLGVPPGTLVEAPRHHLLADPALPGDQHSDVGRRAPPDVASTRRMAALLTSAS